MSGGGAGGKGAAALVPAGSRKLVQSLKEIVNRPEAEIYAALRECGMDPDEAVSRLLSQDTFQEVKSKRDKKKETKDVPEPRSRSNTSSSRGVRGGADRGGRSNSVHSSSTDNAAPRAPVSGPGAASINSSQKQTVASSSSVNKHMVADGPAVSLQSSSGFQHGWSGTPGQLSMADIVKMGRPQSKASSKPVVTADRGYAGQYPSLPSTANQNLKQSGSTVPSTELDKGLPPAQDSIQVKNHGHSASDSKRTYGSDWSPQDEPTSANQLSLPETSGDPSLYEASLQSSTLVADVVISHANLHLDENSTIAVRPASATERHLENSEGVSEYNDGMSYQPQKYSYTEHEVEVSSADVSAAAANFQSLSLHNDDLVAKKVAEDNPAVIIPDHLQVTNTECVSLSFGSFGSGAFSGLLPQKTTDSNVELPVREESAPVDQIDARNQDYYESGAVNSSADENLEAMMGANMGNVDAPSVSQAEHRTDVLDPSGLQYDMPSVSSHAYSNTNTSQPNTMEDPQGNNQAHTLSHLSNLMGKKGIEEQPFHNPDLNANNLSTLQWQVDNRKTIWKQITTEMLCACCVEIMESNNIEPNPHIKFTNNELCTIKENMLRRLEVSLSNNQITSKLKRMKRHFQMYVKSQKESWNAEDWKKNVKDRDIEVKWMREGKGVWYIKLLQKLFAIEIGEEKILNQNNDLLIEETSIINEAIGKTSMPIEDFSQQRIQLLQFELSTINEELKSYEAKQVERKQMSEQKKAVLQDIKIKVQHSHQACPSLELNIKALEATRRSTPFGKKLRPILECITPAQKRLPISRCSASKTKRLVEKLPLIPECSTPVQKFTAFSRCSASKTKRQLPLIPECSTPVQKFTAFSRCSASKTKHLAEKLPLIPECSTLELSGSKFVDSSIDSISYGEWLAKCQHPGSAATKSRR